jgi:hypothetical protein
MKAAVTEFKTSGIITHAQEKRYIQSKRGNYHRMVNIKLPKPVIKYSLIIKLDEDILREGDIYYDGELKWYAIKKNIIQNVITVAENIELPKVILNISSSVSEGKATAPGAGVPQKITLEYA